QLAILDNDGTNTSTTGGTLFSSNNGLFTIQGWNNAAGSAIRFAVDQTSGNVGIGTTTPSGLLELYNPANSSASLQITTPGTQSSQQAVINLVTNSDTSALGSANNQGWHIAARGYAYGSSAQQNDLLFYYWDGSSYNARLYIDNGGDIGVGTASPS